MKKLAFALCVLPFLAMADSPENMKLKDVAANRFFTKDSTARAYINALKGTWILTYTAGSQYNDKLVLDSVSSNDNGDPVINGTYYINGYTTKPQAIGCDYIGNDFDTVFNNNFGNNFGNESVLKTR
jgi:hypothetical protein